MVDGGVIDLNTLHVEVFGVVGVQHARSDVRNVLSSVGLSSNVHLIALHAEGVDEVLPESHKLCGYILLIIDSDVSWGESSANWLIDVNHVGQVCP